MCICVNCHYIDRCTVYYAVEAHHEQPHLTENPDFDPIEPTINANHYFPDITVSDDGQIVEQGEYGSEWDVVGCNSFKLEQGKWAKLRPGELVPT
jgi:hypothetical protein